MNSAAIATTPSGDASPLPLATLGVVTCIHPIPGADNIEIVHLALGCELSAQVITRKGEFEPDDFAIYIRPGAVVPQTDPFEFIWGNYLHQNGGKTPDRRRRIGQRKYLGFVSEGLVMPVTDFPSFFQFHAGHGDWASLVGTNVAPQVGINRYVPVVVPKVPKAPKVKKPFRFRTREAGRSPVFGQQYGRGQRIAAHQQLIPNADVHSFLAGIMGEPDPTVPVEDEQYSALEYLLARVLILRVALGG